MIKLSVVINTLNEADKLPLVVASVKNLADEIVVIDMESDDDTKEVAKKLRAKVFNHKRLSYVEPARNFAVSKATGDWILILDVDEEIPESLAKKIKEVLSASSADYYRIPRKNIIFGRWIKHTRWWPDYNIRLFKKGTVSWNEIIHKAPMTVGVGIDFDAKEDLAIIHNNYKNLDEYLEKMIRYTKVQSEHLHKNGYKFDWKDLIGKPMSEFLGRFFAGQGYKDGVHGLALSSLQAFSELVVYLRLWGMGGYEAEEISDREFKTILNKKMNEIRWWIRKELTWLKFPKFR